MFSQTSRSTETPRHTPRTKSLIATIKLAILIAVFCVFFVQAPALGQVLINEVDSDTLGTDVLEFVELIGPANTALDGLVLVFFNGNGDVSYRAMDLDGFSLDTNGFFVAGNVGVTGVDLVFPSNGIQNGPDAAALYTGDATDFPNGTSVTATNILDAIVYDTSDADDAGLINVLTPGQPQVNEAGGGDKDNQSNQRCPDGDGGALVTTSYTQAISTPDGANNCSTTNTNVLINEVDADTPSTDVLEFVELLGVPNAALDGLVLVFYNGNGDVSYRTQDLDGFSLDANGLFVAGNTAVTGVDLVFPSNGLQNGADGVALYEGNASDFPNGTAATATNIIDAIVYDTNDADDTDLINVLTPGQPQVNEGGAGNQTGHSSQRCPDGAGGALVTTEYIQNTPTPKALNDCDIGGDPALIREIQGATHISPLNGKLVIEVPGIVTALLGNGFFMQDPNPDADVATSEGIFVFTGGAPGVSVGDSVTVDGSVAEFRPGSDGLSVTELVGPAVTVNSSGNPLPPTIVLGNGGRIPPNQVINDDGAGNVEDQPPATFDATTDGIDFYESLEGMRVQVNGAIVVGPTNRFGETWVVGDAGANAGGFTGNEGVIIGPTDFNPERIQLDDPITSLPDLNVGASFTSPVVGVVHYNFENFEVLVTEPVTTEATKIKKKMSTLSASDNHLIVAILNVENLDPGDDPAKIDGLADEVVNFLNAPDIIGLQEVQDNTGSTNDGVVDASATYGALITAIQTAGGPLYEFRDIAPANNQDGGQPGGNIRVGFLFRPDRVTFVDRAGGDATTAVNVVCNAGTAELDISPGRIDPTNTAYNNSRKVLAGEFEFNGQKIIIAVVHFNSKGGDDPLFGFNQPPILGSEPQRIGQAQAVNDFVDSVLACNADANVMVFGDTNDFQFSTPLSTLAGGVLTNLVPTVDANEQYSFIFQGNSQILDNFLISNNLVTNMNPQYEIVHVNADFHNDNRATDHDPGVARFNFNPSSAPSVATMAQPLSISQSLASPNPVQETNYVEFSVQGTGIKEFQVDVYDLSGQLVYTSDFEGDNALRWNLLNNDGQHVANGVYLFVTTARGYDQRVIRSEVKKLVVLR